MKKLLIISVILLFMLGWLPASVHAEGMSQQTGVALDVLVGFDGYIQQGAYFPVTVIASNTGGAIDGELRLRIDFAQTDFVRPLELPRGSRKQVTFYAAGLSFANDVTVELVERGRIVARQEVDVRLVQAGTLLVGAWSNNPTALATLKDVKPSSGNSVLAILTAEMFPDVAEGWRALDVLVIHDVDTGQLSQNQRTALYDWVMQGGRLIVIGGTAYQRVLAGLGELSPVLANDTTSVSLEPLAIYSVEKFDVQAQLEAPVSTGELADDAQILLESNNVPLLAMRRIGYGRVDYLAADPALDPLRTWDGMKDVWIGILVNGLTRPGWAYGFNVDNEFPQNAVANVPGVRLPSVIQLCGFLSLYVILIGPVNYLVLKRLKRRELAWFTIPLLVVLFSIVAYVTGFQLRGSQAIVHRLAVIQAPAGSDSAKVDMLFGIWSPRRARYDIQLEPGYLARPMPQNIGSAITSVRSFTIAYDEQVTLQDINVDVGGIQPFIIEGTMVDAPHIESNLVLDADQNAVQISGEIINDGDFDLQDAVVVMSRDVYPIGDLNAGEVVQFDEVGRLSVSLGNALDPVPYSSQYGYGYSYGYDQFISEVSGVDDCWSINDTRRRCDLLASIRQGDNIGRGIYLIGWSDQVPVETQILNGTSQQVDMAMIIVELDVDVSDTLQSRKQITPGQMNWTLVENEQQVYFNSPYDFYLPSDSEITLRFEPYTGLYHDEFDTLILSIDQGYYYDENLPTPIVEVRNFDRGRWERIQVEWGETVIPQAGPFLDALGGVEMIIKAPSGYYLEFARFDVTLIASEE